MGKPHLWILLIVLVVALACGSKDEPETQPTPPVGTEKMETGTPQDSLTEGTSQQTDMDEVPSTVIEPLFLNLESPASLELVVNEPNLLLQGSTRPDALLTIGATVVEPNIEGIFTHNLALQEGHNLIEIIVSTSEGEQKASILAVIYEP